jgi:hypothetical protein
LGRLSWHGVFKHPRPREPFTHIPL